VAEARVADWKTQWRQRVHDWTDWLRGFIYGMTVFEIERGLRRQRADLEHLFLLITFGDLLGIPVIPPYYTLRLLPYVVPMVSSWKRRVLRERDLTDLVTGG